MIPLEDQDLPHGLDDLCKEVYKSKIQQDVLLKSVSELYARVAELEKNQCKIVWDGDEELVKKLEVRFTGEDGEFMWLRAHFASGELVDSMCMRGET